MERKERLLRVLFLAPVCTTLLLVSCSHTQDYYLKQGDGFARKRDYAAAIAQYELALTAGKPNHRIFQTIAEAHEKAGSVDRAIDNYLKAAEVLKKDGERLSEQARLTRDPDECERLRYLIEDRINPYHSRVYTRLGALYAGKDDHAKAVIAFELALHYHDRNLRARFELAGLIELKGDTEAAIKEWERFLDSAEKASTEDRSLYAVGPDEVATARRHLEKLWLARSGAGAGGEKDE
jgi:tetratricopeptide (TPR) repeat protein